LHLRDQYKNGKWSEALGEGDAIIELAFEGGFKPTRQLKETLKMGRDYLRKTTGI
jgi:hypothetical protein